MRNLLTLLCLCVIGIQYSYQFVAEINDMMNNCRRDGGYCINTIPPPPPRRMMPRRRRPNARTRKGRRRMRNGRKPDPKALGAAHSRPPASAGQGGQAAAPAAGNQPPPYQQPYQAAPTTSSPWDIFGLFGSGTGGGAGGQQQQSMFGMLPFLGLTRKKRQAAGEPMEAAEMPRIRRGENTMTFLRTHCRKTEFDFGCQRQGGFCCLPHLK